MRLKFFTTLCFKSNTERNRENQSYTELTNVASSNLSDLSETRYPDLRLIAFNLIRITG